MSYKKPPAARPVHRGNPSGYKKTGGKSKKNQQTNALKTAVIVVAAVLIISVAVIVGVSVGGGGGSSQEQTQELQKTGVILDGISIQGVDVSGLSLAEAYEKVAEKASQVVNEVQVSYSVNGQVYTLQAGHLGATVDYGAVVQQALYYGQTGDFSQKNQEKDILDKGGKDFELIPTIDEATTRASLQTFGKEYNTEPKNATVEVVKEEDQTKLTVTGRLEFKEAVPGLMVDEDELFGLIQQAVSKKDYTTVLTVEEHVAQPTVSLDELKGYYQEMDSYETTFKNSPWGRRFNIWKMGTVVNGVVLEPGEEWSINEAAGDRTKENGWADANGIKDGGYVEEPGGGICQVSTTLYLALIKSEVEITDRSHHSWPLTYAPVGMDATISTGAPDFKFKNNYDFPIAVIVNCDAEEERKVTVTVYGKPLEYEVRFKSEIVLEEEPAGSPSAIYNPSLKPGATKWVKDRHNKLKVEVYKYYHDKTTGAQIGERELYGRESYRAFVGAYEYGPSASPSASVDPNGTADPNKTKEPAAESTPTKAPESTPTKAPEATKAPEEGAE